MSKALPALAVTVCVAESWLTTVTVSPGFTVSFAGLKAKLLIVICAAVTVGAEGDGALLLGALCAVDAVGAAGADGVAVEEQPAAASSTTVAESTMRVGNLDMPCPCLMR
ncbi:hypothetical protein GCM10010331_80030 [Streptomyces xanthochromogenes]|nr:hypothetical protein GCM10010331_80030 [Streptomyces xanthochromogenes]